MNITDTITPEAQLLIEAVCNGIADDAQLRDLESLLLTDEKARKFYAYMLELDANLQWLVGSQYAGGAALAKFIAAEPTSQDSAAPTFLSTTLHNTLGYFSEGTPLAYLLATLIVGVGLLIGSRIYVSGPEQFATQVLPITKGRATHNPRVPFVGRITGMVDCRWADPHTKAFKGEKVPMGREYTLISGLMEITYDTGAKVILQGPVVYEVESAAGGYLSVGKLTARVDKKDSLQPPPKRVDFSEGGQKNGNRDQSQRALTLTLSQGEREPGSDPQSPIPNPSLPTTHYPLFTVKTPTASVTDLGTEFGVEVSKEGNTTSHVFRGSVELRTIPVNDTTQSIARVLHENEWAIVKKRSDSPDDGPQITIAPPTAATVAFVRDIPRQTIKTLDLVDVVAGGDGFSVRRNAGIDPTTGQTTTVPAKATVLSSDGLYHHVEGLPFVDGVFVPGTHRRPVQIDSAGHAFDGFPNSNLLIWQDDLQGQAVGVGLSGCRPPIGLKYVGRAVGKVVDASTHPLPGATNSGRFGSVPSDPYSYVELTALDPAVAAGQVIKTKLDVYVSSATGEKAGLCVSLQGNPTKRFKTTLFQIELRGNDGQIGTYRPGWTGYNVGTFARDAWVPIEVVANFATRTYTATVGSVHWSDGFIDAATDQACIYLASGPNLTEGAYFDNVTVESIPLFGFPIWAGGASPAPAGNVPRPLSANLDGVDYGSAGHRTLWFQGNTGITFDLEEIRRASPGCRTVRFRATAGCAEMASGQDGSVADIWVFVDGKLRFQRRRISRGNGAFPVLIPIGKNDRFLTLAATSGGDGAVWDWIIFGDPRLEVMSVENGTNK